ncbi:MAG: response regulator transcription factor [Planctomycetes bacterium]|nr:response regulator transcription factor [Planctomycetota bacterium]
MPDQPGLLEKESAAFAKDKPDVRRCRSSFSQRSATCVKLPEMDSLLEETLANHIGLIETLTKREREVLRLIVSGKTNKEIARAISRTERTVEYHRNRLMRKVDAHNAADLVKRAITMGIT